MGHAQRPVAHSRAVPARNILFREGDHTWVLPARREVAQQTDDVPTVDQVALMVATAATGCPVSCPAAAVQGDKRSASADPVGETPFGSRLITSYGLAVISTKTRRL